MHPFFHALEGRVLLTVSVSLENTLLNDGFVSTQWMGEDVFVKPGQWVLQFDHMIGSADAQLKQINKWLDDVPGDVRATTYLGDNGLVLAESPKEEKKDHWNYKPLEAKLHHIADFSELNPNLAVWASSTFPNDPLFPQEWGLNNTGQTGGTPDADIDAPEAWDLTKGDGNVVVGVIDSGIDYTHPDLITNIWTNPGEIPGNGVDDDGNGYVDDVHGYDFANNDSDPMDDAGHGTHVSGTIAAQGNNALGVTGVNWNNKLMALKFIGADGTGSTSAAIEAINYATMMRNRGVNIRVTNNSWGGSGFDSAMQTAINNEGNAGILFVAAAGNSGTNNDVTPSYPASYHLPNMLVVAATDQNDQLASFSNYGANTVDLAAPGVNIMSTLPGATYGNLSGTSMATPHVSGVAALAFSYLPTASMTDVRNAILKGVDVLPQLSGRVATSGRLNAYNTLQILKSTTPTPTPTTPAAPTRLTARATFYTTIQLSWLDNANNETGYQVQESRDGVNWFVLGNTGPAAGSGSTVTVNVTGLSPGTTYYFRVRAFNTAGYSPYSNIAGARTPSLFFGLLGATASASATALADTDVVLGKSSKAVWR